MSNPNRACATRRMDLVQGDYVGYGDSVNVSFPDQTLPFNVSLGIIDGGFSYCWHVKHQLTTEPWFMWTVAPLNQSGEPIAGNGNGDGNENENGDGEDTTFALPGHAVVWTANVSQEQGQVYKEYIIEGAATPGAHARSPLGILGWTCLALVATAMMG